ncbi:MAG: hypothetical protein H0U73_12480 [Tatlockia sp.]|nr:hypothetical protein [Tatlockia sp.]
MKGFEHTEVATGDIVENGIFRKAIYNPDALDKNVTLDFLEKNGYQRLSCEYEGKQKEFLVDVIRRKFIVIQGIPFYSSSGTTMSENIISPILRKNVWMPCMGLEVQGREPGRIAKLGDKCSQHFINFVDNLIEDWVAKTKITDVELRLLLPSKYYSNYDRVWTIKHLKSQLERFGSIEAFATSMQLLSDTVWRDKETDGSNFTILRNLRDFYLENYPIQHKLSEKELFELRTASFEELKETYHVVIRDGDNHYRFNDENELKKQETQKSAYELNCKLLDVGAEVTRIALLNNPFEKIPNTLAVKLGGLIYSLKNFNSEEEAKSEWDKKIEIIIRDLLALEQVVDIENQQQNYKAIFNIIFVMTERLIECHTIQQMSELIKINLDEIEILGERKEEVRNVILNLFYEVEYLAKLKQIVSECKKDVSKEKPANQVLADLNNILHQSKSPKEGIDSFFTHLTAHNSSRY